jgi:cell shape-determining protein MreC
MNVPEGDDIDPDTDPMPGNRIRLILATDENLRRSLRRLRRYADELEVRVGKLAAALHNRERDIERAAQLRKQKAARINELLNENARLRKELSLRVNTEEETP